MNKYRQRIRAGLIDEVNDHLEGRQFLRDASRLGIGRWYGGPFTMKDFYEAKERGEYVHAFLQRMMAEKYDPSCEHCGSVDCFGECLIPSPMPD